MATLEDIAVALKLRLATITGLRTNAVEPSTPAPPAAWPFLRQPAALFDQTQDGKMTWFFSIYILVGAATDQYAQTNLQPYLAPTGTKSIKAAIEGGALVNGSGTRVADYANVTQIESVGSYEIGGGRFIGAVLVCEVAS